MPSETPQIHRPRSRPSTNSLPQEHNKANQNEHQSAILGSDGCAEQLPTPTVEPVLPKSCAYAGKGEQSLRALLEFSDGAMNDHTTTRPPHVLAEPSEFTSLPSMGYTGKGKERAAPPELVDLSPPTSSTVDDSHMDVDVDDFQMPFMPDYAAQREKVEGINALLELLEPDPMDELTIHQNQIDGTNETPRSARRVRILSHATNMEEQPRPLVGGRRRKFLKSILRRPAAFRVTSFIG